MTKLEEIQKLLDYFPKVDIKVYDTKNPLLEAYYKKLTKWFEKIKSTLRE